MLGVDIRKERSTMAKKTRNPDEEMMLAAWEWAAEINKDYSYGVRWQITPLQRKGTFRIECLALHVVDGKPVGVVVKYTEEWPSSNIQGLCGRLMKVAMGVDHVLGIDALQPEAPARVASQDE